MTETYLGAKCFKGGHTEGNTGKARRYSISGHCVECTRLANEAKKQDYNPFYYQQNKEKLNANTLAWAKSNPDKVALRDAKRRARKREATIKPISSNDLVKLYRRFERKCAYCEVFLYYNQVHWDHVIAIARGGSHSLENLVPSCEACNLSKNAQDVKAWLISKNYPIPLWLSETLNPKK